MSNDQRSTFFNLHELLAELSSSGFVLGVDSHLRLRQFLDLFTRRGERRAETLRFQLAALFCQNAEQQQKFYEIFDRQLARQLEAAAGDDAGSDDFVDAPKPETEVKTEQPAPPAAVSAARLGSTRPVLTQGKSGPVQIELKFPSNELRIWNIPALDRAVLPLREKEWAPTVEWDVAATIRQSIRAGGMPEIVFRRRKRAPHYLILIEQRSTRDHLARFYAELAAELNRRDLDTAHFFYDDQNLRRCWRDRRDYSTYLSLDNLMSEFADSRLLVIGQPAALLEREQIRASTLAADLHDAFPKMALLSTRATAEWDDLELALCQLFPVVPATAEGLASLMEQWADVEVFTPRYWKLEQPEPSTPPLPILETDDLAENSLQQLRYYLGRPGYTWLAATAVYPEIYYELTSLLHNESIPLSDGKSTANTDTAQFSWQMLLRLSRLDWFRRGNIPIEARSGLLHFFHEKMPVEQRREVWRRLSEVLKINENRPPEGSFAAENQAVILKEYEGNLAEPIIREELQEKLGLHDLPAQPAVFQMLWVDDKPEKNLREVDILKKEFPSLVIETAVSTAAGLEKLKRNSFHLVVSDISRGRNPHAGEEFFGKARLRYPDLPVIFYSSVQNFSYFQKLLLDAGADDVFNDTGEFLEEVRARVSAFLALPSAEFGGGKKVEKVEKVAASKGEKVKISPSQNYRDLTRRVVDLGKKDSPSLEETRAMLSEIGRALQNFQESDNLGRLIAETSLWLGIIRTNFSFGTNEQGFYNQINALLRMFETDMRTGVVHQNTVNLGQLLEQVSSEIKERKTVSPSKQEQKTTVLKHTAAEKLALARAKAARAEWEKSEANSSKPKYPQTAYLKKPQIIAYYNKEDKSAAEQAINYLHEHDMQVVVHVDGWHGGDGFFGNINDEDFFILAIISKNSFQYKFSEEFLDIFKVEEKAYQRERLIICSLDSTFLDTVYLKGLTEVAEKILRDLVQRRERKKSMDSDPAPFEEQIKRINKYREQLHKTIERLSNTSIIDIKGKKFESGMRKVIKRIVKT